jgi:hypothetical protein
MPHLDSENLERAIVTRVQVDLIEWLTANYHSKVNVNAYEKAGNTDLAIAARKDLY